MDQTGGGTDLGSRALPVQLSNHAPKHLKVQGHDMRKRLRACQLAVALAHGFADDDEPRRIGSLGQRPDTKSVRSSIIEGAMPGSFETNSGKTSSEGAPVPGNRDKTTRLLCCRDGGQGNIDAMPSNCVLPYRLLPFAPNLSIGAWSIRRQKMIVVSWRGRPMYACFLNITLAR